MLKNLFAVYLKFRFNWVLRFHLPVTLYSSSVILSFFGSIERNKWPCCICPGEANTTTGVIMLYLDLLSVKKALIVFLGECC